MFFPITLSALLSITLSNGQFPFFSGVKTNFSLTEFLNQGWKPCFNLTYDDYLPDFNGTLEANCNGEYLLVGCYLPSDTTTMVVGAMGLKYEVLTQTPRPLSPPDYRYRSFNIHNNVSWYFTDDYSFGFAPEDAYIYQTSCDEYALGSVYARFPQSYRMCWYIGSSMLLRPGWSCGQFAKLEYEILANRIVLYANSPSPTTSPTTSPSSSPTTSFPTTSPSSSPTTSSPTMSPVHGCSPVLKTKKPECEKMIRTCGKEHNIKMKWNGKSCPGVLGDSGCQCDQYCGYSCIHACEHDKQCYWKDNQCFNKLTNQPGFPIPHCPTSDIFG